MTISSCEVLVLPPNTVAQVRPISSGGLKFSGAQLVDPGFVGQLAVDVVNVTAEPLAFTLMQGFAELSLQSIDAARRTELSRYEWDLLRDGFPIAGLSQQGWYELFLATNDLAGLATISEFYRSSVSTTVVHNIAQQSPNAVAKLVQDERLIRSVLQNPTQLLSLTPRDFERFTAELLERLGYSGIALGSGSKDGGVDVSGYIEHPLGVERVIVQCKRHAIDHKVGDPTIRQLYADTSIHQAARGLLVTTSYLTRPAQLRVEAHKHRLSALDYDELRRLLRGPAGAVK